MLRFLDVLMSLVLLSGSGGVPGTGAGPDADLPARPVTSSPASPATTLGARLHGSGRWPFDPRPELHASFDPPDQRWLAGHRGVDLVGAPGQQVLAAVPGRVRFAGAVGGKQVVVVDHGSTRTTYEPVMAHVRAGDQVAAGDVLGRLLTTPSHCAPAACLHWGWRTDEEYLDPLRLIGVAAPVRLLPLDPPLG